MDNEYLDKMGAKPMVMFNPDRVNRVLRGEPPDPVVLTPVQAMVAQYNELDDAEKIDFMIQIHEPTLHPLEWMRLDFMTPEFWRRYAIVKKNCTRIDIDMGWAVMERNPEFPLRNKDFVSGMLMCKGAFSVMWIDGGDMKHGMSQMLEHTLRYDSFWNTFAEWLNRKN